MKIVDVCAFYSPTGGGVKTYVEQKLKIGPALGHDITIIAPGDAYEVEDRGPGARIITLPSPRFPLDRNYWYFAGEAALHAALDAERPDVVEVSSPWRSPNMVGRWRGSAVRALVMHADPLSAYAYRWLEPMLTRRAIDRQFSRFWNHLRVLGQSFDSVICSNHDLRHRLAQGGVAGTVTIPMGVEAGLFSADRADPELRRALLAECRLPETAHLLVGAGRLSAEKRWPLITNAVMAASQRLPLGLALFGEGKERRRLQGLISGNPHIRLMGAERDRQRFAAILASADALIHGCEAETFCLTAAEARASGTPVIVPDRGGAADHAAQGSGILYRSGSASSAARAIQRHFADPAAFRPGTSLTMQDHFETLFGHYASTRGVLRHAA